MTNRFAEKFILFFRHRKHVILLLASWICGFAFGCIFSPREGEDLRATLLAFGAADRSVLFGLTGACIALMLSVILVRASPKLFLYSVAFLEAFIVSFLNISFIVAFGSAGWIFRSLMLFIPSTMSVVLLWLWCRLLDNDNVFRDVVRALCAAFVIVIFDYLVISPFAAGFVIKI